MKTLLFLAGVLLMVVLARGTPYIEDEFADESFDNAADKLAGDDGYGEDDNDVIMADEEEEDGSGVKPTRPPNKKMCVQKFKKCTGKAKTRPQKKKCQVKLCKCRQKECEKKVKYQCRRAGVHDRWCTLLKPVCRLASRVCVARPMKESKCRRKFKKCIFRASDMKEKIVCLTTHYNCLKSRPHGN